MWFENDVEMYGAQTLLTCYVEMYGAQTKKRIQSLQWRFENDVEMYGAQTTSCVSSFVPFENDVEMYGAQTAFTRLCLPSRLRMM